MSLNKAPTPGLGSVRVAAVVGFLVFVELVSGIIQGMMPMLLPRLGAELNVSAGDLNWVSSAQLLAAAVSVPLFGRLGDIYGHRRMLRVAAVSLAVGSVLVAWAPSYEVLLLGRVLQGPLAALLPLEMGLVRDRLTPEGARSAIGMLVGALTFGGSVGMLLAGLLGEAIAGVRGILWVPAIGTILCVAVVFFLVPESKTRARGTVDWAGAGLLSLGLSALLLAIAQGPSWGWTSGGTLGLFLLAALVLVVWTLVELRVAHPVVDIRLSVKRNLLPVYGASFMVGAALFGSQTATVLFLASPPDDVGYGFGYDTLDVAWIMVSAGLLSFVGAALSPRLARVIGARTVLALSGATMAVGYTSMAFAHDEPWQLIVANMAMGFGIGLSMSAMPALVLDASPADRTGIATGIYNTVKTLGGSVSGAVFAAILTAKTFPGTAVPTESAYTAVWWCCAGVSVFVIVAAFVVRGNRSEDDTAPARPVATAD
ncbi:MFS transporter [Streptomyces sp. NPDC002454]|uniref:MFS transporter n=1 Tax=Streptomyces sp. NPDC002490 TaxID=3154416 RepID=UPI00332A8EBA